MLTRKPIDQLVDEIKSRDGEVSIESVNHERAMEAVRAAQEPIPEGYNFLHYCIDGAGRHRNTPDPDEIIDSINRLRLDSTRLEVSALLKNPEFNPSDDEGYLRRSILYINPAKEAQFLDGQEVSGKIDTDKLVEVIRSYQE